MSQDAVSRRAWAVVWCTGFLGFAIFSRILCLPPIGNVLKTTLSITHSKVGLIFSLPVAILAATAIPSGLFGDRVGPRRAVGIGMIVLAAGSFASGTASDFRSLFVYTCIFGIGFSMVFSSLPKLMGLWVPADKVGLATGIYTTGISIGGAVSLGITLPVIFPLTNSFRGTFFIWSIPAALGAVLWWFVVKEYFSPSSAHQTPSDSKGMGHSYHVWKNRNLWVGAFILFFLNTQFYTWAGWTPQLMIMKGAKPEVAALMISFNSWVSIPFMFLTPWASHKVSLVRPFIWLAALGYMLSAWAAIYIPVPLGWPLMFLLGVFVSIYPLLLALPVDLVPKEYVGAASGMMLSIGYLGALVGPWLAGFLLDVSGTLSPALVVLIGSGIALGGFGMLLPETGSRSKEHKGNTH
jgi:CP family cyanate transporter-like MFS transporter